LPPLHVPLAQSTLTSHGSPDGDAHAPLAPQAPLAQSPGPEHVAHSPAEQRFGDAGGVLAARIPAANLQIFPSHMPFTQSDACVHGSARWALRCKNAPAAAVASGADSQWLT